MQDRLSKKSFDCAISNPPYGSKNVASGKGPRYSGGKCEYAVIDIASDLADYGVFLIPQASVPFKISGVEFKEDLDTAGSTDYRKFVSQTDRKSTRLNSSHYCASRMPSSA